MAELTIDAIAIRDIVVDCLFRPEELLDNGKPEVGYIEAAGVWVRYGFHPDRLGQYQQQIRGYLDLLPDAFHRSKGEGMSFLAMAEDRNGVQWGEQSACDQLLALGIATGMAGFCSERDTWHNFPGGVPYIWVETRRET